MLSLAGVGFGPFRTEAPRLIVLGLSFSGGGVGGKTLRPTGGSDCCLRLCNPGLTRFVAANEILSAGLSSLVSDLPACLMSDEVYLIAGGVTHVLDLRSSKASESISTIRGGDQSSLSEVVLGLQIPDLGLVWSIDNTNRDGEDGVTLEKD